MSTAHYSPRKLAKCLSDVKTNKLTISQASKLYLIPRTMISSKIHQQQPETKGRNGPESVQLATVLLDYMVMSEYTKIL
jgi:hypothetical protein